MESWDKNTHPNLKVWTPKKMEGQSTKTHFMETNERHKDTSSSEYGHDQPKEQELTFQYAFSLIDNSNIQNDSARRRSVIFPSNSLFPNQSANFSKIDQPLSSQFKDLAFKYLFQKNKNSKDIDIAQEEREEDISLSCLDPDDRIYHRFMNMITKKKIRMKRKQQSKNANQIELEKEKRSVLKMLRHSTEQELMNSKRKKYIDDLNKLSQDKQKQYTKQRKIKLILSISALIFLNLLNFVTCATFIYVNYSGENSTVMFLDLCISVIFLFEFFFNFICAGSPKIFFFLKLESMIDLLTIVPPILNFILNSLEVKSTIEFGFFRILRILRSMRILRFYKTFKKLKIDVSGTEDNYEYLQISEFQQEVIKFILELISILFVGAGIITAMDDLQEDTFSVDMKFLDSFYFVIVTSATIGFGDISPTTIYSRFLVMFIMITFIYVFGTLVSGFSALLTNMNREDTVYKFKNHIIIMGTEKPSVIERFLLIYYSGVLPGEERVKSIIVGQKRIGKKMKEIISNPIYEGNVYYLHLLKFDSSFLKKTSVADASAVFYLTNQFSRNPVGEDKMAFFTARFLQVQSQEIMSKLYFQLAISDELYLQGEEPRVNSLPNGNSINLLKTKYRMMGKAIFCSGLLPLMCCIILNGEDCNTGEHLKSMQFLHSLRHKSYVIKLPPFCIGKSFAECVKMFYNGQFLQAKMKGIEIEPFNIGRLFLLGIKKKKISSPTEKNILFNPNNYQIRKNDYGFFFYNKNDIHDVIKELQSFYTTSSRDRSNINTERDSFSLEPKTLPSNKILPFDRKISEVKPTEEDLLHSRRENYSLEENEKKDLEKNIMAKYMGQLFHYFNYYLELEHFHYNLWKDDLQGMIKNHIVICGYQEGVEYLVQSIRSLTQIPIVFIFEEKTPISLKKMCSKYANILHFQGSPVNIVHLQNSNVVECLKVVILAVKDENSCFTDSNSILTARILEEFFKVNVIVEIKHDHSLAFFNHVPMSDPNCSPISFYYWPNFMEGKNFISSLLEGLVSYSYSSPELITLLNSLLATEEEILERNELCQVYSIPVPDMYIKNQCSFQDLFNDLIQLDRQMICLGIVTKSKKNKKKRKIKEPEKETGRSMGVSAKSFSIERIEEDKELLRKDKKSYSKSLFSAYEKLKTRENDFSIEFNQEGFKVEFDTNFEVVNMDNLNAKILYLNPPPNRIFNEGENLFVMGHISDSIIQEFLDHHQLKKVIKKTDAKTIFTPKTMKNKNSYEESQKNRSTNISNILSEIKLRMNSQSEEPFQKQYPKKWDSDDDI